MRASVILSLSAIGTGALAQNTTTGKGGNAVAVTDNPVGKQAIATLPDAPFFTAGSIDGNVKGYVKATTGPNGRGVDFEVDFSNLPKEGGPFTYHLHVDPVDGSGNCTNTLAHLDPFIRGEDPVCNPERPETCQVGDLSGKYGKIESETFNVKFHDDFTAMSEGPGSYFLNRSIVVHFANKTRITCASFMVGACGGGNATSTSDESCQSTSSTSTMKPTSASTSVPTSKPTDDGMTPINGADGALLTKSLGFLWMAAILLAL